MGWVGWGGWGSEWGGGGHSDVNSKSANAKTISSSRMFDDSACVMHVPPRPSFSSALDRPP